MPLIVALVLYGGVFTGYVIGSHHQPDPERAICLMFQFDPTIAQMAKASQ